MSYKNQALSNCTPLTQADKVNKVSILTSVEDSVLSLSIRRGNANGAKAGVDAIASLRAVCKPSFVIDSGSFGRALNVMGK